MRSRFGRKNVLDRYFQVSGPAGVTLRWGNGVARKRRNGWRPHAADGGPVLHLPAAQGLHKSRRKRSPSGQTAVASAHRQVCSVGTEPQMQREISRSGSREPFAPERWAKASGCLATRRRRKVTRGDHSCAKRASRGGRKARAERHKGRPAEVGGGIKLSAGRPSSSRFNRRLV
jgi:hypothetical protein